MPKQQTNIRLSLHTKRQLRALAEKLGLSEGQLVMLAIDRLARDEGLRVHLLDEDIVEQHEQEQEIKL
jgi:hypothetical protein